MKYGSVTIFLILALGGGEWSASYLDHFTPGERPPNTHWIGGWLGPRVSFGTVEKSLVPLPGIELRPSRMWSVAIPAQT
jgi:hypothetical protein